MSKKFNPILGLAMMAHLHNEAAGDGAAANASTTAKPKKAKAEVETVTMTDGKVVEFAGKKLLQKEYSIDPETGDIHARFDFRNGVYRTLMYKASDPILLQLACHGLVQKYGDEMAAGTNVSLEDRIEWFDELASRMDDTTKSVEERWAAARESSGGVSGISVLVQALMELKSKTAEEIKKTLNEQAEKAGVSKQQLVQALRNNAAIKPTVDRIEAERAAKATSAVDTSAVLAQF
jgi:hypothetical protein